MRYKRTYELLYFPISSIEFNIIKRCMNFIKNQYGHKTTKNTVFLKIQGFSRKFKNLKKIVKNSYFQNIQFAKRKRVTALSVSNILLFLTLNIFFHKEHGSS